MANRNERLRENVGGRFYIDSSCIDCDRCREMAPEVFHRDDNLGCTVVHRQPTTPDELRRTEEAMSECPSESIGGDGVA